MYGFHDLEAAQKIADDKTKETGVKHAVLPAEVADGPPGKYTIACELKATSPSELFARLRGRSA